MAFAVDLLKYGGYSTDEWFLRIFNRCMELSTVLEDWKVVRIISVYKGIGENW